MISQQLKVQFESQRAFSGVYIVKRLSSLRWKADKTEDKAKNFLPRAELQSRLQFLTRQACCAKARGKDWDKDASVDAEHLKAQILQTPLPYTSGSPPCPFLEDVALKLVFLSVVTLLPFCLQ